MDASQASHPSTFEIIRAVIDVGLIGVVGGLGGFLWKVRTDLRNERFERQKALTEAINKQLDRWAEKLKPARESVAAIAIKVANDNYRPVLDALSSVEVYAKTYEIIDQCIEEATKLIDTGKLPKDPAIHPMVRDVLARDPDTKGLRKAMQEARPNCADYLFAELEALHRNITTLVRSGYLWELEGFINSDDFPRFFNWYNAARIPEMVKTRSPEELSKFLKEWRAELAPLLKLKERVPWETFLSDYYSKLCKALEQPSEKLEVEA